MQYPTRRHTPLACVLAPPCNQCFLAGFFFLPPFPFLTDFADSLASLLRNTSSSRMSLVTRTVEMSDRSVVDNMIVPMTEEDGSEERMANATCLSSSSTSRLLILCAASTRASIWGLKGSVSENWLLNTSLKRLKICGLHMRSYQTDNMSQHSLAVLVSTIIFDGSEPNFIVDVI